MSTHPGLHLSEIARRLQWSTPLAEYHLRILERGGWVTATQVGQLRCYFPRARPGQPAAAAGVVAAGQRDRLALVRHPVRMHIVALLARSPGGRNRDIAKAVGLSRPAASHHLARLLRGGVVERGPDGRYQLARADELLPLLRSHPPPPDHVGRFQALWDDLLT